jgi:hypothetical protein
MQLLKLTFATTFLIITSGPGWTAANSSALPWTVALGDIDGILAIEAVASVTVSDGTTYQVETAWRIGERSIFHRIYPDRVATMAREGLFYWSWDGVTQSEIPSTLGDVIDGHQFHARLLFLDGIERADAIISESSEFCDCMNYRITTESDAALTMHYEKASSRPHTLVMQNQEFGRILIEYDDWRLVDGVSLPWQISIDDESRQFDYRFQSITFNTRELWDSLHPSMEKLTATQQLMAMHRLTIDAHIESDITLLQGRWADQVLNVYGGEASLMAGEQMEQSLGQSLANRRHSLYRDTIKPVISVSADGTMGTITAQVEAAGERLENGQSNVTGIASGVE